MTDHDIDLTKAIEAGAKAMADDWNPDRSPIFAAMFLDYAQSAIEATLPHILAQVEARVKPSREDVVKAIWTEQELGEVEGRESERPLGADYAAADAVLAILPGKTEQEVRRAAYDDLIAELLSVTEDYVSIAALSGIVDGLLARGGEGR